MRMTEGSLRRLIRQVIKEQDDCYASALNSDNPGLKYSSSSVARPEVQDKISFYKENPQEWAKVANAYYQAVEYEMRNAHNQKAIRGTGCDSFSPEDYYGVIIGVEGKYNF
tara:strand:- start:5194 stop:5526 length:333 start_codon:yes stop_codon:yes gene_type:complete